MKFLLSATVIASLLLANVEARWKPTPGTTWNYVLGDDSFDVNKEKANVIDVDFNKSAATIKQYQNAGKKVICYFSGGTVETWRNDYSKYKAVDGLVKNTYDGWDDERWLDITKSELKTLIKDRMKIAVSKNCDAIEVDNLDGYQVNKGASGYSVTESDTIKFAQWLGTTAHELGISIGLKNVPGLIGSLESYFDFAINESCVNHSNECSMYKQFLNNNKAVFGITYGDFNSKVSTICKQLNGVNISMIVKPSQNLRQAGTTFDGKTHCGSGYSTGSSGNVEVVKTTTKKTTTTLKRTTTIVSKSTSNPVVSNNTKATTAPVVQKTNPVSNPVVSNSNVSKPVTNNNAANAAASNAAAANAAKASVTTVANRLPVTTIANRLPVTTVANKLPVTTIASRLPVTTVTNKLPVTTLINSTGTVVPVVTPIVAANSASREAANGNNYQINDQFNETEGGSNTGAVVTGVAVTGSVVGAAAVFAFIKKNPKQYEQIKRGISRRATSVKRGASTVTRKLTTKKSKPTTPAPTDATANVNDNPYNTYRYQFTQNFDDYY